MSQNPEGPQKQGSNCLPSPRSDHVGKCTPGSRNNCFSLGTHSERSSLIYTSGMCEKEMKTSKCLRNNNITLFTNSTGESWELRNRRDRGCNPDIMPLTQPSHSLSQLKPNSSRTLGGPLPATLLSPNRKAGGTRGQDLRARESWEQHKGSYSLRVDYFRRCWPGHRLPSQCLKSLSPPHA